MRGRTNSIPIPPASGAGSGFFCCGMPNANAKQAAAAASHVLRILLRSGVHCECSCKHNQEIKKNGFPRTRQPPPPAMPFPPTPPASLRARFFFAKKDLLHNRLQSKRNSKCEKDAELLTLTNTIRGLELHQNQTAHECQMHPEARSSWFLHKR